MTKRSHVCGCLVFGLLISYGFLSCVVTFANEVEIAEWLRAFSPIMVLLEFFIIATAFWIMRFLDANEDEDHRQLLSTTVELTVNVATLASQKEATFQQRRGCCLSTCCIYIGVVCNVVGVFGLMLIWNVV